MLSKNSLGKSGGYIHEPLVKRIIKWTNEDKEPQAHEIWVKKIGWAETEYIISQLGDELPDDLDLGEGEEPDPSQLVKLLSSEKTLTNNQTLTFVSACVRLGEDASELITYEEAGIMTASLIAAMMGAVNAVLAPKKALTNSDKFWHQLVAAGIGGQTVQQAKENLTVTETADWALYIEEFGSPAPQFKLAAIADLVGFSAWVLARANLKEPPGGWNIDEFVPSMAKSHGEEKAATIDEIFTYMKGINDG